MGSAAGIPRLAARSLVEATRLQSWLAPFRLHGCAPPAKLAVPFFLSGISVGWRVQERCAAASRSSPLRFTFPATRTTERTPMRATFLALAALFLVGEACRADDIDLTGKWSGENGTYWIRQVENEFWWVAKSPDGGKTFTAAFHGKLSGKQLAGHFADVPPGENRAQGSIKARLIVKDRAVVAIKGTLTFFPSNEQWVDWSIEPAKPGLPPYQMIRQADSSTCWLLAAMEALEFSGVDLSRQVQKLGDKRYKVRLFNYQNPKNRDGGTYGRTYPVEFDGKATAEDARIKAGDTSAFWVVVLHRGVINAIHEWDPTQSIEKTHGGSPDDAFSILTGRRCWGIGSGDPNVRNVIAAALARKAAVTMCCRGHCYAVLRANNEEVVIYDPYGVSLAVPWGQIASAAGFGIFETRVHQRENLLVNGSFEDGPDVDEFLSLEPGSTAVKGWKVTRGPIGYVGNDWRNADGFRSIDLRGTPGFGGIEQTFKTQKGHRYRVTFSLAANPRGESPTTKISVGAAGQKAEFAFNATRKSKKNMGWVVKEWEFNAAADETTLEFYTLEKPDAHWGPAIDDVRVVPVESPNWLVNGSFEEGPIFENILPVNPGSTEIKGWKVTRGQIDIFQCCEAADGRRCLDLHGSPGFGGIEQTFKAVKGQRYRVTFSLSRSPWADVNVKRMAVAAAGKSQEFTFDDESVTQYDMRWQTKEWEFVAVDEQTTLELYTVETHGEWNGLVIDSVRVWPATGDRIAPKPEPKEENPGRRPPPGRSRRDTRSSTPTAGACSSPMKTRSGGMGSKSTSRGKSLSSNCDACGSSSMPAEGALPSSMR
jgi:choice-of-anchor C domain-containing protein